MKVLLLGSGAATHALAWKILSEAEVQQVYCAPGNAGTALLVGMPPFATEHSTEIAQWAFSQRVDLAVVRDQPALVDMLAGLGVPVIGAGQRERQALDGRQALRRLLRAHGVPCPEGETFRHPEAAERYLASQPLPLWLWPDAMPQREAVRVTERYTAFRELARLLSLDPAAGVSIEADAPGVEVALDLLSDGQQAVSLGLSRPYRQRYDGDSGPLTDGMGAYAPYGERSLEERLLADVGRPVLSALATAGLLRPALLHLGLVLGPGGPLLRDLSWDVDDLHAAVALPRWAGALSPLLAAAARGQLADASPSWQPCVAVAVAMVLESYPGPTPEGQPLHGRYDAQALVFHHATRLQADTEAPGGVLSAWLRPAAAPPTTRLTRRVLVAGGRVLVVVGLDPSGGEARRRAYAGVEQLEFEQRDWRRDIAAEL